MHSREFKKTIIPIEEIDNIEENKWLKLLSGGYAMYKNIDRGTGDAEVCHLDVIAGFGPHHALSYSFLSLSSTKIAEYKEALSKSHTEDNKV